LSADDFVRERDGLFLQGGADRLAQVLLGLDARELRAVQQRSLESAFAAETVGR
jgi:hypothetical protein